MSNNAHYSAELATNHNIIPFLPSQVENTVRFYRKHYKDYDLITRANDPTKVLQEGAKALLIDYSNMLNRSEDRFIVIEQEFIQNITKRKKDQNNSYHKQLADIFNIKFHHSLKIFYKGKQRKYWKHYTVEYTENGRAILENPAAFYIETEREKSAVPQIKPVDIADKTRRSYIEDNNNIIIKKDIAIAKDQNMVSEKVIEPSTNCHQLEDTITEIEQSLGLSTRGCKTQVDGPITENLSAVQQPDLIESKKAEADLSFNLNISKVDEDTTMTTETLPESGKLKDFYPLLEQDHDRLKEGSGRNFSLAEMNSILLKLSEKLKDHSFDTRRKFLNYMSKILRSEKGHEGEIKEYKLPETKGEPVKREPVKGKQETVGKLTGLVKKVFLPKHPLCEEMLEALDIFETDQMVKIEPTSMRESWESYRLDKIYYDCIFNEAYWALQSICEEYNFTVELSYPGTRDWIITPETKKKDSAFRLRTFGESGVEVNIVEKLLGL